MRRMILFMTILALAMLFSSSSSAETVSEPLVSLPALSEDQALALGEYQGPARLTLKGEALPYDPEMNFYLLPVSADTGLLDNDVLLETDAGWEGFLAPVKEEGSGWSVDLYVVNGPGYFLSHVALTTLPVLCVDTESGELPGREDERGFLTLYETAGGAMRLTQTPIEINLRGNNSRRLPKKSYRVKIVDEEGEKRDLSMGGLRSDDDWILNPMYSDTSKIREALGYWLWSEINSFPQQASSSRLVYGEVFFDGLYHGLYGLQERVDRKQVNGDKKASILYKVTTNDRPTVQELLECEDVEICKAFEVIFQGSYVIRPWIPAADYIALLDGGDAPSGSRLSLENAVDFGLWSMLCQAHDLHFKNQYVHCVPEGSGYVLYRIPWDLNNTFGDVWSGQAEEDNFTDYRITSLVMDDIFRPMVEKGDGETLAAIRSRWAQLRAGIVTEEEIITWAQRLHYVLSPAIERDNLRWPESGMGEGNAANIRDIERYIRDVLPRMDEWAASLGRENEYTADQTEVDPDGNDMDRGG